MSDLRSFRSLSTRDRQDISGSLLNFLGELEALVESGFGEERPGSRAERLATTSFPSASQGPYPGRNALETVLFATLAGIDHARLFARSIVQEDAAFALATLTRGSVEAYARAWWIIESEDDVELVTRWLSGLADELASFERLRPDRVLHEVRGRNSTAAEELEGVLDDIEQLTGARKPRAVSFTKMASSLADQWKANGRIVYSDLSGVAHGESLGIHSFVEADDDASVYRTTLNERSGIAYSGWVLAASGFVGREVLTLIGQNVTLGQACAAAQERAVRTMSRLRERILA